MIDFQQDGDGKIISVKKNGKDVKKGFMRGMKKAQTSTYWKLYTEPATFSNPFTGVARELGILESSIYNWCIRWYGLYKLGRNDCPIQTYDDMKYFLLELDAEAYYDLLD